MLKLFLSLFLSFANAQSVQQDHFLGLNDSDSPATLTDQCQACLNVETNISGTAIIKRKGYSRVFSLTVATSPVTGSHTFIDGNGNRQDIVCHDHYCAKSTNGTAFSNFLSTAGANCLPTRWSMVDINGKLYLANDCRDAIGQYDGTTFTSPLTMPQGTILELTKDRLVVADTAANPNGVNYSQQGTYTNFTTGINSVDPYIDYIGTPGNKVTGLKYAMGKLYIFKPTSVSACILGDQYTSRCYPVSNSIGTSDPGSIVEIPTGIVFRGTNRNYWKIDESGLIFPPISRQISVLVSSQTQGSSQSNTQTSQADWQAGTQSPSSSWDTVTVAGSVFPSSTTVGDNTTAAFSSGTTFVNVSTTDVTNGISLSSGVFEDKWSNNIVAGRLGWTVNAGTWDVETYSGSNWVHPNTTTSSDLVDSLYTSSTVAVSSGSFSFTHVYHRTSSSFSNNCSRVASGAPNTTGTCFEFRFLKNAGGDYYSADLFETDRSAATHLFRISKTVSSVKTVLTSVAHSFTTNQSYRWNIIRDSSGKMYLNLDGVQIASTTADTSVTSPTRLEIASQKGGTTSDWNDFTSAYVYQYRTPAQFISRAFDTAYSTPTWGPLSSTFTVLQNSEGQVVFYTQASSDGSSWDSKVASSDTIRVTSAQKRYIRYEADFTTTVTTKTPTITVVNIAAATTGQFTTQCIQPGSGISSWGLLSCAETTAGSGSLVIYATSAVSCATLPTGPPTSWQSSVSNNATLSISVSSAVYLGFRSLLGSSTDQAQLDACILAWNNGATAPPVWGVYDPTRNAVFWNAAINNSATNNRTLKYDLNLGEWFPFDIAGSAPLFSNSNLYFGDSTGGYWNQYGTVDNDNGSNINAYWKSRDYGGGDPFSEKRIDRISLVAKNQGSGSLTTTYTTSNNVSGSYTVSLATTTGAAYVRANYALPLLSPYQFFNLQIGNNSQYPFEVDGLRSDFTLFPWKAQNP